MKRILWLLIGVLIAWPVAASEGNNKLHVKLVFVDFYGDDVTVLSDGQVLWSGHLTVPRENETTGLSMTREVDLPRCSEIVLRSKDVVDSESVCLTDKTTFIYLNAKVKPYISISVSKVIELD
jgi:hypothetical protein